MLLPPHARKIIQAIKNKKDFNKELKSCQKALDILNGEIEKTINKNEIDIIIIKKIAKTPDKFPRAIGIAKKRAL